MSSSFDINCTVEGAAPDNLTHECGVTKNLTWTGNGTHSGLSFNLIRSQLTDLTPRYGYIKPKATKVIKFAFTPVNPNIGSSKVTVRVKYNIDGVLTTREVYDLGNISSTVYKFHELLVDLDIKNNAFLILDVITSDGTSGAINITIDCAPSILSAEFCYGFTNTNQYCNLCPQTITFYREKSPGTNTTGLINNNSTTFSDFTQGPWYIDNELTTEVSENIPYQFKNELGVVGTSVYTYSSGKFVLQSVCGGTKISCSVLESKTHYLNVNPTEFKFQNPYLPGTPDIKLDGLRYSIKETTVELPSKHRLVQVRFYWTGGTANRVAYQVTDGNFDNSVGNISYNTTNTSNLYYPADNVTLFEAPTKGTYETRYFLTTTGKLKIRAIVGLKNGTISNYQNTVTKIIVGDDNGSCGNEVYSYEMDVHPYSPYDAANSAKVKTTVYSLTPIENWVAGGNNPTKIYQDPLLVTLALPYYYYNSTTNKIYKIGETEIHREWGTKTRYKVTSSFFGGTSRSQETLGPKDWTLDYSGIKQVPACIDPMIPKVGNLFSISLKSSAPQPTQYSYLLGYDLNNIVLSNNNYFTSFDFENSVWTPITGYEHALGRMLRKYVLSTGDRVLNELLDSERWGGGGLLGRFFGVLASSIVLGALGIAFAMLPILGIIITIILAVTDLFTKGKVWDIFKYTFGTFSKTYEEDCKMLSVRYSSTPYLIDDASTVYRKDDNSVFTNDGYYCDGFYFYQIVGGLVQSKELAYKVVGGIRKNSIMLVHTETNTQDYITDFDRLLYLTYTAGRPTKYAVQTYTNSALTTTISNQSNTLLGDLNNFLPITFEVAQGRVTAFSQIDADNQAQAFLDHLTSTSSYLQSKEPKPGNEKIVGVAFTHEIKDENEPNLIEINYNNSDELGITIGKKLYYDSDGYYTLLNGYYSVSPGSYKKVYKLEYGYVTDIMVWENESDTTVTSVTTGTHNVVTTNKDYTSQWLVGSHIYQDVDFDFGNDVNGLEGDWNSQAFYTGSTVYRAMVKGGEIKDSILVFDDNNMSTTTYSEAESKMYRQMYPFTSEVETYYTPHTFTIKSEEICDLDIDDSGVRFTVYDSDNIITPSIVGVTFIANFYSGSSVLFATETVTIAPESTTTLLQLNIPYSGHTVTSVDITSYESPNPFNKVTFQQGSHTESDGVVPCQYYTGLTYQVISFGYVQYTNYTGDIIFTNQTEGIYTIDDIVEFESVYGSLDENYSPSANIKIIEHGDCMVSKKPTNITLDNSSVDEGTPIDTVIGNFSTVSATPSETYVYTLVSGTGSSDNSSFGLTTGGTLSNLITLNYDVKTSYTIRVRSTDPLGGYYEKSFTITVNNVNRAPYGINLDGTTQSENTSINTVIGEFVGLDYDANETFTFELYDTDNYPDNNSFNIHKTTDQFDVDHYYLRNSVVFNYEVKNSYTIKVKVTDSGNLTYSTTFLITIGNVNEPPTGLFLSNTSVYENLPTGTTVGTLSTADEDTTDTYSYIFNHIPGTEDDNDSFYIDGDLLKTSVIFDYETKTSYNVRIRAYANGGGYTYTKNFTIDINDVYVNVTASATSDYNGYNITCHGGSNGIITVDTPSGNGTTPYTYSIDGTTYQSSKIFSGLTAGTYTIYAKESGGEVGTKSVTVTEPDVLGLNVTNKVLNTCFNDNNASFTLVGTGGVSPYTYSLNGTNYQSSGNFQNLSSQTYYGYVKDANNCTYGPLTISDFILDHPTATVNTTGTTCNGGSNGAIRVSNPRLGNSGIYSISLVDDQGMVISGYQSYSSPITYTGLTAGGYYVYVKDSKGCEFAVSTAITQPTAVTVSFSNVTKPTCYSGNTGSFRATASGGNGSYSYRNGGSGTWTGFSGNYIDFTSKSSGTYSIQFKDGNNCVSTVESVDLNVAAPDGTITITGATCYGGSDGRINVSGLTGDAGPYSAKLMFGGTTIDTYRTVTTNRTYTGLVAGTYLVYFKDGNGCEKSYGAIVTEPNQVVTTLTPTNPTCYDSTDGSISATTTGGNGSYTYSINGGSTYQVSETFTGLGIGTYTIYAKDSNGCTGSTSTTLSRTQITATITPTNPYCYGNSDGRISISSVSGGQGTYSVKLNSNGTYESFSTSKTYSGLSDGSYTVYIKDVANCVRTYSVTLTQPAQLTISGVGTNPTCYNSSDGSITLTSGGGTGTKTYYISSNGVNYGSATTGNTFSNLSVGTYSFLVVDGNSCTAYSSNVVLSKLAPSATETITNVSCNGGSDGRIVLATFTNGTPPYSVSTNGGTTYTVVNTSFTYSGLTSGNYTIFIKDANNCVKSYLYSVTQPTALSVTATGVAPTCYDGSNGTITTSGSGGTSPYEYSINGGSTYQTSTTFSNLTNGTYTITVRDSKGCTANSSTVTLNRTAPNATISVTNPSCFGGTGSIDVSSGSGGSGSGYQAKNGSGGTYQNLPVTFSSLGGGTYTIYIKDGSGCVQTYDRTITVPSQVTISVSSTTNPTCSYNTDGSIVVTSSGGTGTKTYSKDGTNYQSSGTFAVGNGTYTLYAKDANGCVATTTASVNRAAMNPTLTIQNVSCRGGSDGQVSLTAVSGGAGTLSQWTWRIDSDITVRPSNYIFGNLAAGSYDFTIFDANNCVEYRTVTITQPSAALSASITNVVAASGANNDGQMTLSSAGGTWPKTYYLYKDTASPYNDFPTGTLIATYTGVTSSAPTKTLTNLSCGYYWLLVNDANGCSANTLEISVGCSVTPDGYFVGYYNSTACSYINPINIYYVGVAGAFENGKTYYNSNGTPIDGSNGLYYMDGNVYGTINSQGVFTQVGTCA